MLGSSSMSTTAGGSALMVRHARTPGGRRGVGPADLRSDRDAVRGAGGRPWMPRRGRSGGPTCRSARGSPSRLPRHRPMRPRAPPTRPRMRRLNEAWAVLGDPARRATYDATLASPVVDTGPVASGRPASPPSPGRADPDFVPYDDRTTPTTPPCSTTAHRATAPRLPRGVQVAAGRPVRRGHLLHVGRTGHQPRARCSASA